MRHSARNYVNDQMRVAPEKHYSDSPQVTPVNMGYNPSTDGTPITLPSQRAKTTVVGPVAGVMRLWAIFFGSNSKSGGSEHAKM